MNPVTAGYLVKRGLQLINVIAEGKAPTGQQMSDGLYTLCEAIDAFNADGDLIFSQNILIEPLANGTVQSDGSLVFTIGPISVDSDVSFNVPERPTAIEYAAFRYTSSTPPIDIPLRILTSTEWGQIRTKGIFTQISNYIYMDEQWPVGNIYLWPSPQGAASLYLSYWNNLPTFLTENSLIQVPPGYTKLFRYEFAAAMAPEFGKTLPPDAAATLAALKRTIKYNNIEVSRTVHEAAAQSVQQGGAGAYNILNDEVM